MLAVDHLDLNVTSLARAEKFYDVLAPALGLAKTLRTDDVIVYSDGGFGLYLIPNDSDVRFKPDLVGLNHLAFKAASRAEVDRLHQVLTAAGLDVAAPPRESTDYPDGYYAFFFRDPDGIPLEYAWCPRR